MLWHICIAVLAAAAVPIWSRALNDIEACENKSIYIMDLGMFAAQHGVPQCDVTKARYWYTCELYPMLIQVAYWTYAEVLPVSPGMQDVKIDPGNGIPYLLDHIGFKAEDSLPYALAQHSGPWHLMQAINTSRYVAADMDAADIVYVYDHCYYMLWLAQVGAESLPSVPAAREQA